MTEHVNNTTQWTHTLFPRGAPLVYHSSLNGKLFARQWTLPVVITPEGLIRLDSFLEIDPAVLGQGGSRILQRTRLFCKTDFEPVRYENDLVDTFWSLRFEKAEIVLNSPAAGEQRLPRAGAQYVFGATAHQAIAIMILHDAGVLNGAALTVFLPEPLLAVPYELWMARDWGDAGRWIRTSHDEELVVDACGVLRECNLKKRGISTSIVVPPPAPPAWSREKTINIASTKYTPPPDARFRLEDITINGRVAPIGATLSIPEEEGRPVPAVLFLGGSGRHDRHGIAGEIDIGSHEIVDYLAGRGFFGLRYDTRGAGNMALSKDAFDLGLSALIEDARACFEYLEQRPEVDGKRIFLIGHSEGGTLALALASRYSLSPRGIVLMACTGRTIDQVMYDQIEWQGAFLGLSADQIAAHREELQAFVEFARSDRPAGDGTVPDYLMPMVRGRQWLREHLENPASVLITRVRCPVLICQGKKDFQVSPERDAKLLEDEARSAGVDVELAAFSDLDHLFKETIGESRPALYYDRERKVSTEFLAVVDRWLLEHQSRGRPLFDR